MFCRSSPDGDGFADGGEGVGGVELGGAGGGGRRRGAALSCVGGEAAALQADLVEAVGVVVALDGGERVGEDVLRDGGAAADVGVACRCGRTGGRGRGRRRRRSLRR